MNPTSSELRVAGRAMLKSFYLAAAQIPLC